MMTLQECYSELGGNYEETLGRLQSDRLVHKFVCKFLTDPSYDQLTEALAEKDRERLFRAVHTLKGVCQNLGFDLLFRSSNLLCEAVRNGWAPETQALAEQVAADYAQTVSAIQEYQASVGGA